METIELTEIEFRMMINDLTRYEMKLHLEHLRLTCNLNMRDWPIRKRVLYLRREMKRVGAAIYAMMLEYDHEWGKEL